MLSRVLAFYKTHTKVLILTAVPVAIIVSLQLLYPKDWALPFAKLNGQRYILQTKNDVNNLLSRIQNSKEFNLTFEEKTYTVSPQELGVSPDIGATERQAGRYPVWMRLLPLSAPIYGLLRTDTPIVKNIQEDKLQHFVDTVAAEQKIDPIDATISVSGEQIVLTDEKKGKTLGSDSLKNKIKNIDVFNGGTISLTLDEVEAAITKAELNEVYYRGSAVLDSELVIDLNGEKIKLTRVQLAGLLDYQKNQTGDGYDLTYSKTALDTFLVSINPKIYIEPGITTITLLDGVETAKILGSKGRTIDTNAAIVNITNALNEGTKEAVIPLAVVASRVVKNKTYSYTQNGFQKLVEDAAESEKGRIAVKVEQLSGNKWSAEANGTMQFTTASTYKLFIAWQVYKKLDEGVLAKETPVRDGQNVQQCLEDMIINSDNECPSSFVPLVGGWTAIQNDVNSQGFSSTKLNVADKKSTVTDQVAFMKKLYNGQLVSTNSTAEFISLMKQQRFRQGIPKGTKVTVADKVGFLNGLLHDTAIVYGQSGVYLLSVYTDGSSWQSIANISSRIHDFLN